jgi:hypothetical protein
MQNLPTHLQNLQAPDLASTLSANLGSAMPPHVSIGGGRFTLIDAGNNEIPVPTFDPAIGVYLDAAIIGVNPVMSRVYFAGAYDPQAEGSRPDCFSDNGIGPSVSANSPQAPTCAICPRAEWTKINNNGKKVPWCSQKQKVALLIPGFQTLFLLAVPPNSHGPMREYVEKCKGNGVNIANLITRISFVPGVQGTLQFQPVSYIDAPTAELRQAAYAEKKTDALVGRNDVARPAGAVLGVQGQIAATPTQLPPPGQQFLQSSPLVTGPAQQAQQPAPFVPTPAAAVGALGWPAQNPAPTAATTSPSEPAPTTRRRRRTAAEMQADAPQGPNGQAPQQPAAAPQAPFPHPGNTQGGSATAASGGAGSFGIAQGQPAAANPELAGMLDSFFKQG